MKITTRIYLDYGTTIIHIDVGVYSSSVILGFLKSKQTGDFWKDDRKVYEFRLPFTKSYEEKVEYEDHIQWIKSAWFEKGVKPPYNFNDYDPIPF